MQGAKKHRQLNTYVEDARRGSPPVTISAEALALSSKPCAQFTSQYSKYHARSLSRFTSAPVQVCDLDRNRTRCRCMHDWLCCQASPCLLSLFMTRLAFSSFTSSLSSGPSVDLRSATASVYLRSVRMCYVTTPVLLRTCSGCKVEGRGSMQLTPGDDRQIIQRYYPCSQGGLDPNTKSLFDAPHSATGPAFSGILVGDSYLCRGKRHTISGASTSLEIRRLDFGGPYCEFCKLKYDGYRAPTAIW